MGLDVYFRRDIANVLRSAAASNVSAQANRETAPTQCEEYYHAGFYAALVGVGLAFGLEPVKVEGKPAAARLLWAEMPKEP